MSLQGINKECFSGNDGVSSAVHGEYVVKLMARRRDGRHITQQVEFGIGSDSVEADLNELDQAASVMAARIAKLSEGVIVGLYKKLGKYRPDEVPTELACNSKQYATIILSNDPKTENPDADSDLPREKKTRKIYVPWLDDATSRQDMRETLLQPVIVSAAPYYFSVSKFADEDKTDIAAYPLKYFSGLTTKCYNTSSSQQYLPNDTDEGIGADGIVSEGMTEIASGSDDQDPKP